MSRRAGAARDGASVEPPLPGRAGSRKTRAHGNGAGHAANVRGFRWREIGGTHFWKIGRAQGAAVGRGDDQRASYLASPRPRDRTPASDEPPEGARGPT